MERVTRDPLSIGSLPVVRPSILVVGSYVSCFFGLVLPSFSSFGWGFGDRRNLVEFLIENGSIEATVYVRDLDMLITVQLLEYSPAVLSLGHTLGRKWVLS